MNEPINDLWLILIGPVLIAGVYAFAWLVDHFFGDCRHEWSDWQSEVTEHAYVQHKECIKCKYVFTTQLRKMAPLEEKK
jgi:hypothetical protein